MNQDLQTRLESIKEQCRKAIELGEAATSGPWRARASSVMEATVCDETGFIVATANQFAASFGNQRDYHNAAFIAHSHTFSTNAARALLVAIEWLEAFCETDNHIDLSPLIELCNQWEAQP